MNSRQPATALHSARLFQGRESSVSLRDRLMTVQAEMTLPFELGSYYRSPTWHNAVTVLDVGTGNGAYLRGLAAVFPNKHYVGIDVSEDVLELAAEARSRSVADIEYESSNLFDFSGSFDFVILRAVLQHLEKPRAALDHCLTLVNRNGALLVADSPFEPPFCWPPAPNLEEVLQDLRAGQLACRESGLDLFDEVEAFEKETNTQRCSDTLYRIPSTFPRNRALMIEQGRLVLQLLSQVGLVSGERLTAAMNEWQAWSEQTNSYLESHIRVVEIVAR